MLPFTQLQIVHFLWKFFCRFCVALHFSSIILSCSLLKSMVVVMAMELCLTPTISEIQSLPRLEKQSPQGTVLKLKKLLPPLKNIRHLELQHLPNLRWFDCCQVRLFQSFLDFFKLRKQLRGVFWLETFFFFFAWNSQALYLKDALVFREGRPAIITAIFLAT